MNTRRIISHFVSALVTALLLTHHPLLAADKPPDPDEAFLRTAKVPTDDAGLLKFLHDLSNQDAELLQLDRLIRQLGSATFEEREQASKRIVGLGLAAFPALALAARDSDREVVRRAEAC